MKKLWQSKICVSVLFVSTACLVQPTTWSAESFELQNGDRVAFLGDALIEQEQYAGWIELMMTAAFPALRCNVSQPRLECRYAEWHITMSA